MVGLLRYPNRKFNAESNSERILKINQNLAGKSVVAPFYETECSNGALVPENLVGVCTLH